MAGWEIALILIASVVGLAVILFVILFNILTRLKLSVEEAFSSMDVLLKKRYDLVPNLVETVKGYAKHEKEILTEVVRLRNVAIEAKKAEEVIDTDGKLACAILKVLAVVEKHPELKSDMNFLQLQKTLSKIENEISLSRRYYNAVVKSYNTRIRIFPSNIVAKMSGFSQKPMYEVEDEEERKYLQINM